MILRTAGQLLLPILLVFATYTPVPQRSGEQEESRGASAESRGCVLSTARSGPELRRAAPQPDAPEEEPAAAPRHDSPYPPAAVRLASAPQHTGAAAARPGDYVPVPTAQRLPYHANAPPSLA